MSTATDTDYDTGHEFESIEGEHFRGDIIYTIGQALTISNNHYIPVGEFIDRFGSSDSVDAIDLYIWLGY